MNYIYKQSTVSVSLTTRERGGYIRVLCWIYYICGKFASAKMGVQLHIKIELQKINTKHLYLKSTYAAHDKEQNYVMFSNYITVLYWVTLIY